ncbi:MAG: beta-ketoacyl-ACP synthase III [Gemmatimonadota bacterium]
MAGAGAVLSRPSSERPPPRTHIAGSGRYLPAAVLPNSAFAATAGVDDAWILQRTGIRERRTAAPGEGTAAMGAEAARRALASAGKGPADIQLIIVATSTPDHLTPPSACEIQAALGVVDAACFDVEAGFAGWIYALITADALLRAGMAEHALVIGAEKLSSVTDRSDPATGPLFGDGAGAVVLSAGAGPLGIVGRSWWADGTLAEALVRRGGGSRQPFDEAVLQERSHLLRMEGSRIFRQAVRTMARQAATALERAGEAPGAPDLVVAHQANRRILDAFARETAWPPERMFINIDRYGNTGAATIPIALDEAREQGRMPAPGVVLLVSFGAGATAGAVVLR